MSGSIIRTYRTPLLFAVLLAFGNACDNSEHKSSSGEKPARTAEKEGEGKNDKEKKERKKPSEAADTVEREKGEQQRYPDTRSMAQGDRSAPIPGTASFREHFDQKAQRFRVHPEKDTSLRCKEGTILHFPANAFETGSGKAVHKKVKLRVKEYYERAEILMAGLGTKSNDRMLETGGMVHIEARAHGEPCELREERTMQIEFPRKKGQKDMKLFSGERQADGRMNWEEESEADLNNTYSRDEIDQAPFFPGGDTAKTLYIMENTEYPATAQAQGKEGIVRISTVVSRSGKLQDLELIERAAPSLNRAAFSMVKGMPSWTPGKIDGQRVRSRDTLEVKFQLSEAMKDEGEKGPMSAEKFEKKMEGDGNIEEARKSDISNYLFSSEQMGWLNCDRFIDRLRTKEYVVELDERAAKSDVKLFLHEQNSYLCARYKRGRHIFEQVPRNAEMSLVVIRPSENGYKMAVEFTNTRNEDPDLTFDKVTMEGLKTAMKKLKEG